MSNKNDNPGRGDPHHPQYNELKIQVFDAILDFVIALVQRVEPDDSEEETGQDSQ